MADVSDVARGLYGLYGGTFSKQCSGSFVCLCGLLGKFDSLDADLAECCAISNEVEEGPTARLPLLASRGLPVSPPQSPQKPVRKAKRRSSAPASSKAD